VGEKLQIRMQFCFFGDEKCGKMRLGSRACDEILPDEKPSLQNINKVWMLAQSLFRKKVYFEDG
jgi:hypothetical protein